MLKLSYSIRQKKHASTLVSLGLSEFAAAEALLGRHLFREAVAHMYLTCFHLSQALLLGHLTSRPSHKKVLGALHTVYGGSADMPRRYVDLHSDLLSLHPRVDSGSTSVPSPYLLRRKARVLSAYVRFATRHVPQVDTVEILHELYEANRGTISDLSYDVYCPKTYRHHTRITFWQPPSYLPLYGPEQLARHARKLLGALKVRRTSDYVVGLNSKLDQYRPVHLLLLDMDCLDATVESALAEIGGVLLKSGRGFHFIGRDVIVGQKAWASLMRRLRRHRDLKDHLDKDHIDISLQRGYATLRVTASPVKPLIPVFFKEL